MLAVQVLLIAGVVAFKLGPTWGPPAGPVVMEAAAPDFIIDYDARGFYPAWLEVPAGSTVAFHNLGPAAVWPASDPWPSHTDYPALNAGRAYTSGQSWVFAFDRAGTYGYGDALNPQQHAVIRVLAVGTADAADDKTPDYQLAARDRLLKQLVPSHPESVFQVIDQLEADPEIAGNCHSLAHDIGHRAYNLYGFSGAMNVRDATRLNRPSAQDICAGGYLHGILEEAALHRPDIEAQPEMLCQDVPAVNRDSCFHGLGHALMFIHERSLDPALAQCLSQPGMADRDSCVEGVWMEEFWGSTKYLGEKALGWDPQRPLDVCLKAVEDSRQPCFLYSPFGYLRSHPRDYQGALQLCADPRLAARDAAQCFKGVGISLLGHFQGKNLEQAETYASGLDPTRKQAFYLGLIRYARFSGIPADELAAAFQRMTTDGPLASGVLVSLSL